MQLLERLISFRLSAETHRKYAIAARQQGMDLSKYLRTRLETEDAIAEHLDQLRLTLLDRDPVQENLESFTAVLLEILLLTRRAATPADLRVVHYELERQGLAAWTPDPPSTRPD